ncbi:uncharacterized protein LOC132203198 isoform X2 [Neocloeon triangulifer]|uniref:uncharacterized protein LOC132203198 isoform X2 n=1 Tax=Neocloeon triangulifer TaxID=2078957 RepID=UPI00286FA7C5|nr:uncharacterized protein LOC132203198 isoform X2 [Neocloeon triangulifer]
MADKNRLELDKYLRDGYNIKKTIDDESKVIVLLGKTGSGKSTLSKFIREDKSLKVTKNIQDLLEFTDNDVTIGSKNCLESKTTQPNINKDSDSGYLLIDCAGFEDTRSPEQDLIVAFINKNILDSAKNMIIVLVENYSNLLVGQDRSAFTNNLKHLSALIDENVDSFQKSIGLIATKTDLNAPQKVIQVFLEKTKEHLEKLQNEAQEKVAKEEFSRQIKILTFMLEGSHFEYFYKPEEEKSPWKQGLNNWNQLRRLLFGDLKSTSAFKNEFNVTVAPETKNHVVQTILPDVAKKSMDLLDDIVSLVINSFDLLVNTNENPANTGLVSRLVNFVSDMAWQKNANVISSDTEVVETMKRKSESVVKVCNEILNVISEIKQFDDFKNVINYYKLDSKSWDDLKFQVVKLRFLHGIAKNDLGKFDKDAAGLFGRNKIMLTRVKNTSNFHTFLINLLQDDRSYCLKKLKENEVKVDFFNSFVALLRERGFNEITVSSAAGLIPNEALLKGFKDVLQACASPAPSKKTEENSLIFSGKSVALSHIETQIRTSSNRMHTIAIVAAKIFYVDCDVHLQNTHLVIMAPQVVIVNERRTLTLAGENGIPHEQERACDGAKALHGNPGYSSGSLRLLANGVKNASLLCVRSVGGDGSDGQHGCDGRDAQRPSTQNVIESELVEEVVPDQTSTKLWNVMEKTGIGAIAVGVTAFVATVALPAASVTSAIAAIAAGTNALASVTSLIASAVVLTEKKCSTIIQIDNYGAPPEDGLRGGDAGAAATAGGIQILAGAVDIDCDASPGKSGKFGSGGNGGVNESLKLIDKFKVTSKKKSRFFGLIGKYDHYETIKIRSETSESNIEYFPNALSGQNGSENEDALQNYKFRPSFPIHKLAEEVCTVSQTNLSTDSSLKKFLESILTENDLAASELLRNLLHEHENVQENNINFENLNFL